MFINFLLFFFLVFKLIVGPIASVQLLYLIRAGKMRERPRRLNFAVGILWAAINIWWAREIANSLGITIFSWPARIVTALVLGAAVMSGGYLTTVLTKNLRWRSEVEDRFLRTMLPNALTDLPLWILLSVAVGISEELVFRGVLFNLLSRGLQFGSANRIAAVLICVAAFAMVHAYQGWKAVSYLAIFGAAMHLLVFVTGSLLPAMAVHFLNNSMVGVLLVRTLGEQKRNAASADAAI